MRPIHHALIRALRPWRHRRNHDKFQPPLIVYGLGQTCEIVKDGIGGDLVRGREGEDLLRVAVQGGAVAPGLPLCAEVGLELDFAVVEAGLGEEVFEADEEG